MNNNESETNFDKCDVKIKKEGKYYWTKKKKQ